MKNAWIIVALLAILVVLAGCQEEQQRSQQSPVTAQQMGQIVEWSKIVDNRLNAIANVTDPNSLISQLNGQFAKCNNNLNYLYNTVLDPNDPNSLTLRVEVLEANNTSLNMAVQLNSSFHNTLEGLAKTEE